MAEDCLGLFLTEDLISCYGKIYVERREKFALYAVSIALGVVIVVSVILYNSNKAKIKNESIWSWFSRELLVGGLPLLLYAPDNKWILFLLLGISCASYASWIHQTYAEMMKSKALMYYENKSIEGRRVLFFNGRYLTEFWLHNLDTFLGHESMLSFLIGRAYKVQVSLKIVIIMIGGINSMISQTLKSLRYGRVIDKYEVVPMEEVYDIPSELYDLLLKDNPQKELPGHHGIINVGNTCYLSAGIHSIAYLPMPASIFINDPNLQGALVREFKILIKNLWEAGQALVDPTDLLDELAHHFPKFLGSEQQDAMDFLFCILEGLDAELKTQGKNTTIMNAFEGECLSIKECKVCKKKSSTKGNFKYLMLPLHDGTNALKECSLIEILDLYLLEVVLDGDNMLDCTWCNKKV